jgi:hypothetical protein
MFEFRGRASGSPIHGVITPAALFGVRLCIAKVVFRRQTSATTQERGASAPRGMSRNANPKREIPRIAIADAVCNPTAG